MSSQKGAVVRAWRSGLEAASDRDVVAGVARRRRGGRMRCWFDALEEEEERQEVDRETRVVSRCSLQSWTCKRRVMVCGASVFCHCCVCKWWCVGVCVVRITRGGGEVESCRGREQQRRWRWRATGARILCGRLQQPQDNKHKTTSPKTTTTTTTTTSSMVRGCWNSGVQKACGAIYAGVGGEVTDKTTERFSIKFCVATSRASVVLAPSTRPRECVPRASRLELQGWCGWGMLGSDAVARTWERRQADGQRASLSLQLRLHLSGPLPHTLTNVQDEHMAHISSCCRHLLR